MLPVSMNFLSASVVPAAADDYLDGTGTSHHLIAPLDKLPARRARSGAGCRFSTPSGMSGQTYPHSIRIPIFSSGQSNPLAPDQLAMSALSVTL